MTPTLQGRPKVHSLETLTQLALLQMARKTGAQVPGVCNTPGVGVNKLFSATFPLCLFLASWSHARSVALFDVPRVRTKERLGR